MITGNYEDEILSLLNDYIDNECDMLGVNEVLRRFICLGAKREILLEMGFNEADIDYIMEEVQNEFF